MPMKDSLTPEHPLSLFLSEGGDEPDVRKAWGKAVISRILKTSTPVAIASVIAIMLAKNSAAPVANVTALLADKSALQPVIDQSTPTILLTSGAQALAPTARNEPARDETPDQRRTESQPSAADLLGQFQGWAAEKDAQAQVMPVQPVQADPALVVQNAPVKVTENARASTVQPTQKHRHRPVRNARAALPPVQNLGKKARRKQNARERAPLAQDARAQNQSEQGAQAPKAEEPLSTEHYATGNNLPYDDDQLKQKLVICRGCGPRGDSTPQNKSMTSVPRNWNSD